MNYIACQGFLVAMFELSNTRFGNYIHRKSEHAGLISRVKSGNVENFVRRSKICRMLRQEMSDILLSSFNFDSESASYL